MVTDDSAQRRTAQSADARRQASFDETLGHDIGEALSRHAVSDVLVNEDGNIRVVEGGEPPSVIGRISPERAESLLRLLAGHMGAEATPQRPLVSGMLPNVRVRFQGILPPVTRRPVLAFRKASTQRFTLNDLVRSGALSPRVRDVMGSAIESRANLLIAGGTGSGKTTLAGACLREPSFARDRIVVIEDTRELDCKAPDCVELLAPPGLNGVTMDELLRTTLRLFPRRIVVGEVRGGEALTLIKAWGTGHPGGLCTLHANGARDALFRLEDLIREVAVNVPRAAIARAIDLVVFMQQGQDGCTRRRVTAVTRPRLTKDNDYAFEDIEI